MTTPTYDADFYTWTQQQAAALRAKESKTLDLGAPGGGDFGLGAVDRVMPSRAIWNACCCTC